jgi:hypothetical protein
VPKINVPETGELDELERSGAVTSIERLRDDVQGPRKKRPQPVGR